MGDQKIVIIGDVHGCYVELRELLDDLGWRPGSQDIRVILAGDLVDRGPDSAGVVRFARVQGIEIVRGNHDDRYVQYHQKMIWHKNNPRNTAPGWLNKYPARKKILEGLSEADLGWLAAAPTSIFLDDHRTVVVHAGFMPGVALHEQADNTKMHIRFLFDRSKPAHLDRDNDYSQPRGSTFWAEDYQDDWHVVYGHHVWDLEDIKIHTNPRGFSCYGIDTGVCFGGKLTGLELSKDGNHKIHQVNSRQPKEK